VFLIANGYLGIFEIEKIPQYQRYDPNYTPEKYAH